MDANFHLLPMLIISTTGYTLMFSDIRYQKIPIVMVTFDIVFIRRLHKAFLLGFMFVFLDSAAMSDVSR